MADKKISALTSLAQGDVAVTTDVLPIVDTSATETKKVTAAALVGAGLAAGVTSVDINSGSIDGTTIGANSAAAGTFTNLTASGTVSFSGATVSNGGSVTTVDINGGTIDGATIATSDITVGSGKTLNVSAGTLTLADNQISGDKVEGGTINAITINTLTSTAVNATTVDATNVEVTNVKAKDGTAAATIADSTGVVSITANPILSGGTANGVLYLNGSKVATSGSGLTYNGSTFVSTGNVKVGSGAASNSAPLMINTANGTAANIQLFQDSQESWTMGIPASSTALTWANSGTEQMRLTSTGLGIGTSSPGTRLHLYTGAAATALKIDSGTSGTYTYYSLAGTEKYTTGYTPSTDYFSIGRSGVADDFILKSGNAGLGVTPSAWSVGKAIEVAAVGNAIWGNGAGNIRVLSNSYYDGAFKYATSSSASQYAQDAGTHAWSIAASGTAGNTITFTQAMTLNASGSLALLATSGHGCELDLSANGTSANKATFGFGFATASDNIAFLYNRTNNALVFGTNNTERARITSGGDFCVGTTSAYTGGKISVNGGIVSPSGNQFVIGVYGTSGLQLIGATGGDNTIGTLGASEPLIFRTVSSERGRFTAGGYFKASNDGVYVGSTGSYHELRSTANETGVIVQLTNATLNQSVNGIQVNYSGASPNGTSAAFLYCNDSTTLRASIRSNGGLANYQANNVDLSDARTKKEINPIASMWDKIGALEIVTYKYNDQTHDDVNVGVIAQQVEAVDPVWVDSDGFGETPEDGVPLKTVYTKDIYFAAIKALQEAMARIEQLETKVAALESK